MPEQEIGQEVTQKAVSAEGGVPLLQVKNLRKYFPIKKSIKKENSV